MAHANLYQPEQVETLEQAKNELEKLAATVNQIIENQKLVQRDDGCLMDCVVVPHTLSDEVVRMIGHFELVGAYAARPYQKGQVVTYQERMYVCAAAHHGGAVMDMAQWRLLGKAGCNDLQKLMDNKLLWFKQNAILPYDSDTDYPVGAVTLKGGKFQKWDGAEWSDFIEPNAILPYDSDTDYPVGTVTLKDGKFQKWDGAEWADFIEPEDSQITTWSGRTQEAKNKENISITDFYKLGDTSMSEALNRAFLQTKSLFIPSDEFIFLNEHIINGDNLELWGDGLFVAKSLNFLKFTGNNIKINGISLEAFNSDSMINSKLLSVGGANCKINDIKVFGSNRASVGIETTGELNEISSCRLNGFYSYNGSTQAIRSFTSNGSIIKGNTIRGLYSEKDDDSPATASSRAIYHGSRTAELKRTIISDNIISDIYGVEGDAIQILFNNSAAHLDSKTIVKENTIDGFSRRAIKIQANNVKVKNNDVYSNDFKADQPNLNSAIDIQYVSNCVVTDNTVDVQDMGCIQVYGGNTTNLPNARDNVIKGNTVKLRNPSEINRYAIYCDHMYDSVVRDNEVYSKARGIGLGNTFDSAIKGNTFTGGHSASIGIVATSTCGNLIFKDNDGLNFNCTRFIQNHAKESVVKDNYTKLGTCVDAGADAAKSIYADNINNNSLLTTYGTFTNQYIVNGGINMQGFNATPKIMFSDAEPATTFPNLRFNRGDKVFPRYPSATSGSPLSWVATQNGVGAAAAWVVADVAP